MPTTLSPLRYPGGKTVYAGMLDWIIQKNGLTEHQYVEPFAGGAGAAITLLLKGKVSSIWLNDLDWSIYAFWKSILEHTQDFVDRIKRTRICIAEWKRQREVYRHRSKNLFDAGFATFYLNRCNRSGILAANPVGGIRQTGSDKINARFNKKTLIRKIEAIAAVKADITVTNVDAKDLLEGIRWSTSKSFIYFDPPYYQKGELLYMNYFSPDDHVTLGKAIRSLKAPWILSYDDRPEIRTIYHREKMYLRSLRYTAHRASVAKELIVSHLVMPAELKPVKPIKL